ncbi:hypothetical protein Tco_0410606 [Tanacetum coccineum]
MAGLEVCTKHNMVAYLDKNEGTAEFHEVMDSLTRSSIYYALTVSSVVSTSFVEQFWTSAKSKTVNNISYIDAIVAGKPVSISEASIRSDLFNDADGIDSMSNQAIFDAIQLMGYEGDLNVLTFNKALFSPQWKFLFHTMNHCISSKSTSWDQIPTNIATAMICLTTNQKYNFSKLIFDGMKRNLADTKKFVMYPRFLQISLANQLKDVPVPLDNFPLLSLTKKVLTFMVKKGKNFSGKVTPLFASMLVPPPQEEGEISERPSKTQPIPSPTHISEDHGKPQPVNSPIPTPTHVSAEHGDDQSLRPKSPTPIVDSNPETSGGNQGGQSSNDASLSGNEVGLTIQIVYDLCMSLCQQVSAQAKQIKRLKAQVKKLKKDASPVINHHRACMRAVKIKKQQKEMGLSKQMRKVFKQGRNVKSSKKSSKGASNVQSEDNWVDLDEDIVDVDDKTEDEVNLDVVLGQSDVEGLITAVSEGTVKVSEGTNRVSQSTDRVIQSTGNEDQSTDADQGTDREDQSTVKPSASADKVVKGTDGEVEGTEDKQVKGTDEQEIESTDGQEQSTDKQEVKGTDDDELDDATQITKTNSDDETIAQLLVSLSQKRLKLKEKEKGVEIKDVDGVEKPRTTSTRSVLTLKPLPKIDPSDKGKKKIVENEADDSDSESDDITTTEKKFKQLANDEELARKLQADLQEEMEQKSKKEEVESVVAIKEMYDEVQAGIEDDALFAAKLQEEEREEYTIEERARFLQETIVAQRKFKSEQRSAEIRSRPPTKSQLRNLMMTYLKNMVGYKHFQLKSKTFEEIQVLYETHKKSIQDFVPIGSEEDERQVLKEFESPKAEVKQEEHEVYVRKRPGRRLKMKARKRSKWQKTDSDVEDEENLKAFLQIIPNEDEEINYEVLDKRYLIINWESKFYHIDSHGVECIFYKIFRSDGSSRWFKSVAEMITKFDRMDLEELNALVMKRFLNTSPTGIDLILWGDLRIMFGEDVEDGIWRNQEKWILKSWNFYENCEVYILQLEDGTELFLLAERRYPLTKETLKRMTDLKLVAEFASESAYNLLRFIQMQIDEE